MNDTENKIKETILGLGADVCGIGGIDRFAEAPEGFSPADVYKDCRSVIAFGIALPKGLTKVPPRLIYGHYNYFLCPEVDEIAIKAAKVLEGEYGAMAVPLPSDSPYEYWEPENMKGRGLISLKHAAALCGLGRLGKNTLLMNPRYGNLLVIGAVLTDLELKSDPLCGEICIEGCRKCIDACPVHAIDGNSVNQLACRQNTYGKTARGFDTVDCNQCRVVCPRKYGVK